MRAYYNENDPGAAAWLRELIRAGAIADGYVDERSIEDVCPVDLHGFGQHHFFAGIGGWPLALARAGWPAERPVWTGSCPCQPFSPAGKGHGFLDERHVWPAWEWLIEQYRPDIVFGEQTQSPAGLVWLDLVSTDLERAGYAFGASVFPAAGVGAPHQRHRIYWMADRQEERRGPGRDGGAGQRTAVESGRCGSAGGVALADSRQRDRLTDGQGRFPDGEAAGRLEGDGEPERGGEAGGVADAQGGGFQGRRPEGEDFRLFGGGIEAGELGDAGGAGLALGSIGSEHGRALRVEGSAIGAAGAVRGFWRDAEWIACTDGKYRPIEPTFEPLVAKFPGRVGLLRGFGNALCVEQAVAFIEAYMSLER